MASREDEPLLAVAAPKSPKAAEEAEEGPSVAFRWTMLFFICVLTFGSYFVYDNPGALQNQLMQVRLARIAALGRYLALRSISRSAGLLLRAHTAAQ